MQVNTLGLGRLIANAGMGMYARFWGAMTTYRGATSTANPDFDENSV